MKPRHLLSLLAALILLLTSCDKKGDETDYNPNVKSSRNYVYAEDILFEIINIYLKGITDPAVMDSGYAYIDNCGISYFSSQHRINFAYGAVDRWCPDNKYRRGSFDALFSGTVFSPGTVVTFTFDSLFVDKDLVEGDMESEFKGINGSGFQELTFNMSNGRVTLNDTLNTSIIQFETNYTLTWEQGYQTPADHSDDMFSVTGTARGKSIEQYDFEVTIQEPLTNALDCFWIISGVHQIMTPSAEVTTGTIDYITSDQCFYQVDFYFGESFFYDYLKH